MNYDFMNNLDNPQFFLAAPYTISHTKSVDRESVKSSLLLSVGSRKPCKIFLVERTIIVYVWQPCFA